MAFNEAQLQNEKISKKPELNFGKAFIISID